MTLFAGAFSLRADKSLPAALQASLRRHLRAPDAPPGGQTREHAAPGLFIAGWDSGAFAEPAWQPGPQGSLSVLAGDPLWTDAAGQRPPRGAQLERLAPPGRAPDPQALAHCRGSFALACLDAAGGLSLATDLVGLRSIYYMVQDEVLVFATALRILEAVPELRKQLSVQGMAELSACSFPLAERSPYEGISILREAELLHAVPGSMPVRSQYFDWAAETAAPPDIESAARLLNEAFRSAVRLRAGQDRHVYSFLSGGMDSRAIVAMLAEAGHHVEALNFSSDGSQDQLFAQRLAAQMPGQCRLHCLAGGSFPNFSLLALAAKTALEQRESLPVERPQFIWSGDGGSVGLGHVYMDEAMLELAETRGIEAAADHFMRFNRIALPSGVLNAEARKVLPAQLRQTVIDEMNRYPRADLGRRIYLFLLFNDQRRHLFKHFESIDRHGLELLTPFYDAAVLRTVAAVPARWGILHRLYAQWFELLPAFARRTPWQTYPGHVPCPVPNEDATASYQWTREAYRPGPLARLRLAGQLLASRPRGADPRVFSTGRLYLAALSHALGLRDCRHVLSVLQLFERHAALAEAT